MTKGLGYSDPQVIGVTWGYKGCLRKGRVRTERRRKLPGRQRLDELAPCLNVEVPF